MFLTAVIALLLVSANAFSISRTARATSRSLNMAFAGGLPGNEGPELKNFDPLGLAEKSPEWVPFFREAELKHGRIAMLATAGWLAVDLGVTLPDHAFSSVAAHNAGVTSGAMIQILFWTSLFEIISCPAVAALKDGSRKPGDFGFDPLGFGKNAANLAKYQVNELKNGRLAMMAIGGLATQSVMTGHGFPYLY